MISQRTPFAILLAAVCLVIIGLGLNARGEAIDPAKIAAHHGAGGFTFRSGQEDIGTFTPRAIVVPGTASRNDFVVTDCVFNTTFNAISCTPSTTQGQGTTWSEGTDNGSNFVSVSVPASLTSTKAFAFDANGYMHKSFVGENCYSFQGSGTQPRVLGRYSDGGTLSGAAFTCTPATSTAALTDCQQTANVNIYACANSESRVDGCTLAGHLSGTINEGNTGTFSTDTPAIADNEWLVVVPGSALAAGDGWGICVTVTQ